MNTNNSSPVIAAVSTPLGRGALACLRLTGEGSQGVFAEIIRESARFKKQIARKIGVYTVINSSKINTLDTDKNAPPDDIIDEVTAVKYDAPYSFTGEEMVEIFCHGGSIIPRKILDRLFSEGVQPAGRGEFSRRALINGKVNLLKAESIAGLIDCQTEKHLKSVQSAYIGRQLETLEKLRRALIGVLADIESRIEFGEEDDIAQSRQERIDADKDILESVIAELDEELRRSDKIRTFDNGAAVTLAGPPNAGKSSLFNEILGYDRSIVHDRPGTTRDIVSEKIAVDGAAVKLSDSAGIRETEDVVEQCGINRTQAAVKGAHFVLWVTSADTPLTDAERREILNITEAGVLVVINKTDIASSAEKERFCKDNSLKYIAVSLKEKINTDALFNMISTSVREIVDNIPAPEIIINDRHRRIAGLIVSDLRDCLANFSQEEVAAHYLRISLDRLAEFLGHTAGDEVLDDIFEKFCVGK